jgi:ankyrin repeat protein
MDDAQHAAGVAGGADGNHLRPRGREDATSAPAPPFDVWDALLDECSDTFAQFLDFVHVCALRRVDARRKKLLDRNAAAVWEGCCRRARPARVAQMARLCSQLGKTACLEALLRHIAALGKDGRKLLGADARDEEGDGCLHLAARAGHVDAVQALLGVGEDELLAQTTHGDCRALDLAVAAGHVAVVEALAQREALARMLLSPAGPSRTSTLQRAIRMAPAKARVRVVAALLDAGGRELAMLTDEDGTSCLMRAAQTGQVEVVAALLRVGGPALALLTTDDGRNCLFLAAEAGRAEVVPKLLEAGGRQVLLQSSHPRGSCLHTAVRQGHGEVVTALLEAGGAELWSLKDGNGMSCLHVGVLCGRAQVVGLLLEAGGREMMETVTDPEGDTCLHLAAELGDVDVLDTLLDHGGQELLLRRNLNGRSCLWFASANGSVFQAFDPRSCSLLPAPCLLLLPPSSPSVSLHVCLQMHAHRQSRGPRDSVPRARVLRDTMSQATRGVTRR